MHLILDYNDYYAASRSGGSFTSGAVAEQLPNGGWCPFCKRKALALDLGEKNAGYNYFDAILHLCMTCGWWETDITEDVPYDPYLLMPGSQHYRSILRTFDPTVEELPVRTLQEYAKKNPDVLYSITYRNMEELVKSVFQNFYKCYVHHIGKTGDGGIDLLLVQSDKTVAVQVKRRKSPSATEGVQLVREFLGAMLLDGKQCGIIVTTANRFTKGAAKAAAKAVKAGFTNRFDLIDFKSFIDILSLEEITSPHPSINTLPACYHDIDIAMAITLLKKYTKRHPEIQDVNQSSFSSHGLARVGPFKIEDGHFKIKIEDVLKM